MITTTEIAPSMALAPFVRYYSYHKMDSKGQDVVKPWHATHQMLMDFYFEDKPVDLKNPNTGQYMKGGYGHLMGLGTQYNGEITYNGSYTLFGICFRPTGFNKIFNFATNEVVNLATYSEDFFDARYKILFNQLAEAKSIEKMVSLVESFLLFYINRQKSAYDKDGIASMSMLILKNRGIVNMDRLAYEANMSLRTFERHFTEQVGVSPKLYSCMTRFNHAFDLKLKNPEKDWTSITHEAGYFDQMHLIKDFKRFSGNTPTSFLKLTPLTDETFESRVDN